MARRRLMIGAAALAPLMASFGVAAASTELALMCDVTLGAPLLLAAGAYRASTGVRIQVFPTAPGLIADRKPWTVEQLHALPQVSQVTRHVCVEGWSMIGKWTGTPLSAFLQRVGADPTAKYAGFECADGYYEGIDMQTALHPQTIMAFRLSDAILPTKYGFPFKIRIPTKLGFKNPKFVTTIYVTNTRPRGFWTDRGFNWFSGI